MLQAANASIAAKIEFVVIWVLLVLTWLTVAVRFYIRCRMTRNLGWDDGFMLLTLTCFTHYCAFMLVIMTRGGFTKTELAVTIPRTITYVMLTELFYVLATTFLKIALALFFMRILIKRWQRVAFYVVLTITTVYGVLYAALAVFQCGLPTSLLEHVLSGRGCVSQDLFLAAGYVYAGMNILADWTFVVIPLFMLRGTTMDKRSKFSVAVIMLLGSTGSVASVIRIVYMKGLLFGPDFFAQASNIAIWSTIEPGTAIIAGSLATFRPLMRLTIRWVRHTVTHSRSNDSWRSWTGTRQSRPTMMRTRSTRTIGSSSIHRTMCMDAGPFGEHDGWSYYAEGSRAASPTSSVGGKNRGDWGLEKEAGGYKPRGAASSDGGTDGQSDGEESFAEIMTWGDLLERQRDRRARNQEEYQIRKTVVVQVTSEAGNSTEIEGPERPARALSRTSSIYSQQDVGVAV